MELEWYDEEKEKLKLTLKNGASEIVLPEDILVELSCVIGEDRLIEMLEELGIIIVEEE